MGDDNLAQPPSLSCLSQNSNAYNFLSNENVTLKLRTRSHFGKFFPGIHFFRKLETFKNSQNYKAAIYEFGV